MKNITDYFLSPTKSRTITETATSTNAVDVAGQNVNTANRIQNDSKSLETTTDKRHGKKRKRKRKPTDPEVRNVVELLSNNLTLISPNTSTLETTTDPLSNKKQNMKSNDQITVDLISEDDSSIHDNGIIENRNSEKNEKLQDKSNLEIAIKNTQSHATKDDCSNLSPKVNAFQFLMTNRNNVIGQNSDGKSNTEANEPSIEHKSKLEARKQLFESWADRKGACKRKREDKEVEICINKKLERRKKRLENMLGGRKEDEPKLKTRKKSVRKISSSEESSNDSVSKIIPFKSVEMQQIEENAQDNEISNLASPIKKFKETGQNDLLNFFGVINKVEKDKVIEVFEESEEKTKEIIKIKMFTPRSFKNRSSFNKTDESSQEGITDEIKKHKKGKHKPKEFDQPQKLDKSMEDFCLDMKKAKGKTTLKAHKKSDNKQIIPDSKGKSEVEEDTYGNVVGRRKSARQKKILGELDNDKSTSDVKKKPESTQKKECTLEEHSQDSTPIDGRCFRKRTRINYKEISKVEPSKSLKNVKKTDQGDLVFDLSSNSDYEELEKTEGKSTKVAPVFLKATPKPKVDREVIEARKKFLLSGIPDTLKKTVEKQKSIEEKEGDVFPSISHIQQKCQSIFWTLPSTSLDHLEAPASSLSKSLDLKCRNLIVKEVPYKINLTNEAKQIKYLRTSLHEIKLQNPGYPVFKVFKEIYDKSSNKFLENIGRNNKRVSRRRSKKLQRKELETQKHMNAHVNNLKHCEMWTEKYKPKHSKEILGNFTAVNELKKWLEIWMSYSQEINARKRKRTNSDSESEFESTDCDSRDSMRLPGNTMILYGPCGSGKTSAVYAIANELGFNVLELNASTKRTGKRLLQELQEATQSHQVRKHDNHLNTFLKLTTQTNKNDTKLINQNSNSIERESDTKKMCILLLEDIDLVFEQDEGFLSSLSQLITTSKRPIILTTTDHSSSCVQKFMSHYECISFKPLSPQSLAVWLQIVCLVEGLLTNKDDLGNLLEYNKGDIRKTILELQFWHQSGGQLEINDRKLSFRTTSDVLSGIPELKAPDDELSIEVGDNEVSNAEEFVHRHCLNSFEVTRLNEEYLIPESIDLGMLWWNIPNLIGVPSKAIDRLQQRKIESKETIITDNKFNDQSKLNSLLTIYNSLTAADSVFKVLNCWSSEPVVTNWSCDILESMELEERTEDCNWANVDLARDLSHTLINRCIDNYRTTHQSNCCVNMAMPDSNERRWRANQHMSEGFLKAAVPLSNVLDRRSTSLDYLPTLREIARFEEKRASSNTKRGNRFRHYLKDLNLNFKPSSCKMACSMLSTD